MPDLSAPVSNCLQPPCYSGGQILEGLVYLLAVLLILVFVLAILTRVLGGRLTRAAPSSQPSSGAYGVGGWAMAVFSPAESLA